MCNVSVYFDILMQYIVNEIQIIGIRLVIFCIKANLSICVKSRLE